MPYKNKSKQLEYNRLYNKRVYRRDKDKIRARLNANKEANRKIVRCLKYAPCKDCGNRFDPVCMDFDHIESKSFSIAIVPRDSISLPRLLKEIEKCDLVCSNCHRLRTRARSLMEKR